MTRDGRDPVAARSADSEDLYGVADWEVRTAFDRLVYWLYYGFYLTVRVGVVLAAVAILAAQFVLGGLGAVADPVLGVFTVLSAVPALALAAYVWDADVTTQEPLHLLVATFVLGVLFASFAGVLNGEIGDPIRNVASLGGAVPLLGSVVFFYLVVGPVEETVKLLAVRLFAFRSDRFDAVVDGAVYGAVAGLGFATIENALYITQGYQAAAEMAGVTQIERAVGTATSRAFVGPGHVLYSAIAGYYLGLAKFNREHAGPIVVKGILIAALIHATYNTLVTYLPAVLPVWNLFVSLGVILGFDLIVGYFLYRKLSRYTSYYHRAEDESDAVGATAEDG